MTRMMVVMVQALNTHAVELQPHNESEGSGFKEDEVTPIRSGKCTPKELSRKRPWEKETGNWEEGAGVEMGSWRRVL